MDGPPTEHDARWLEKMASQPRFTGNELGTGHATVEEASPEPGTITQPTIDELIARTQQQPFQYRVGLINSLLSARRGQEAMQISEHVRKEFSSPEHYEAIAAVHARNGFNMYPVLLAGQLLAEGKGFEHPHRAGRIFYLLGDYSRALELFGQAQELVHNAPPNDVRNRIATAYALSQTGDIDEARQQLMLAEKAFLRIEAQHPRKTGLQHAIESARTYLYGAKVTPHKGGC